MAFLQMPESAGGGDILKPNSAVVAKHSVWDQRGKIGISGAQVEIEIAIIIEIAEVGAHGVQHAIKTGFLRHVLECTVAIVAIQARPFPLVRKAEIIGADIAHTLNLVSTHVQVIPAIIVIIEKPTGETFGGLSHASLAGDISEFP